MRITSIVDVRPAEVEEGVFGFDIDVTTPRGPRTFAITSAVLGELLTEAAYEGQKTARDYEHELLAAVNAGAERARTERPS